MGKGPEQHLVGSGARPRMEGYGSTVARAGLGAPWGLDPPADTHICTQAPPREPSSAQSVPFHPPNPHSSRTRAQKSPLLLPAPVHARSSTSCSAANSSKLNQRRGKIAKPLEMNPKPKFPLAM